MIPFSQVWVLKGPRARSKSRLPGRLLELVTPIVLFIQHYPLGRLRVRNFIMISIWKPIVKPTIYFSTIGYFLSISSSTASIARTLDFVDGWLKENAFERAIEGKV